VFTVKTALVDNRSELEPGMPADVIIREKKPSRRLGKGE